MQTDVTQYEQVVRLVDQAVKTHGRIDVILNNAGVMPHWRGDKAEALAVNACPGTM